MSTIYEDYPKGKTITSRDRVQKGKTTGGFRPCQLAGCCGKRIGVRWPQDGRITWPCSRGMARGKIL